MNTTQRVNDFLVALANADGDAFVVPPGLGHGWRAKHVKIGLERHVLTIHHSGQGFAFTPFTSKHGRCQECSHHRDICTHCQCEHCKFDRLTDERYGPKATAEQVARLRAQVAAFKFGPRPTPAMRLDGE